MRLGLVGPGYHGLDLFSEGPELGVKGVHRGAITKIETWTKLLDVPPTNPRTIYQERFMPFRQVHGVYEGAISFLVDSHEELLVGLSASPPLAKPEP